MFRTLSQAVVLDAPFSGDATRDAAAVLTSIIRRPDIFRRQRAIAAPAALDFTGAMDG